MDGIFGGKANVTPLAQFDSGIGANLYGEMNKNSGRCDSSTEVFLSGWEETQEEQPPLGLTTPASQLDLSRRSSTLDWLTCQVTAALDGDHGVDEDDKLLPPIDFTGTAMDPSPSLMNQCLFAHATNGSGILNLASPMQSANMPQPLLARGKPWAARPFRINAVRTHPPPGLLER
ncbi:uncharacterized protein PGTG_05177 [Puccinia graminis f. sp. tritici CRL 75-36-700-3]|uniref:Uncharacterized protein n=1 Tax=Puccinia graminis f. sp. tritici (strain CRL 75-36-700-3 / race SCCL) TaxID=418459 RepID=E3K6X8_PUCGT|nr:uncharacterized protein PGTG_05177 [Puccinia graminis f. sp. tritici CRL 75-36-700-3]EFP79952.1 hypothetical protein PGTG_05177 [Puccinia graminis f. sp. tritici CRL 75-36-700-3]